MTTRKDRIARALTDAFTPIRLEVEDDSARHHGHAGAAPGGETHYTVRIVAEAFAGKTALARHRLVNEALAEEFGTGLHALAIEARAP
ncbi:BolA family protein [Mongoliimonas terrestris]|uniref:BolA family protein n=1 Tax=Mongoliimonas terrestris TaxID=1709001 RepID=UPI0009498B0A|nr:BolA family protein [Mongoliimonas terrestris]